MSTKRQLRKIHFLCKLLALADDDYGAMLTAYGSARDTPPVTSGELTAGEASALIQALEWVLADRPDVRRGVPASRRQQARIHMLWRSISRGKNPAGKRRSLDKFLQRRFGVRSARVLWNGRVPMVIRTLTAMSRQGGHASHDLRLSSHRSADEER